MNLKEKEVEAEALGRQVKLLNDQIKRLSGENESIYNDLREGQEQIRLSSNEIHRLKIETDEHKQTIEMIKKKQNEVKSSEYEAKIANLTNQIDQLQTSLDKKTSENNNLSRKLHEID